MEPLILDISVKARHNPSEFKMMCERSCFSEPSAEESTNVNDTQLAQSRL